MPEPDKQTVADTVICNGEIVYRHRTFTRIDESHVYRLARESVMRMLGRLGIQPTTSWPIVIRGLSDS